MTSPHFSLGKNEIVCYAINNENHYQKGINKKLNIAKMDVIPLKYSFDARRIGDCFKEESYFNG
jgi:hypothetical protein